MRRFDLMGESQVCGNQACCHVSLTFSQHQPFSRLVWLVEESRICCWAGWLLVLRGTRHECQASKYFKSGVGFVSVCKKYSLTIEAIFGVDTVGRDLRICDSVVAYSGSALHTPPTCASQDSMTSLEAILYPYLGLVIFDRSRFENTQI